MGLSGQPSLLVLAAVRHPVLSRQWHHRAVPGRKVPPDVVTKLDDREWLVEKYVDEGLSGNAVGRLIGVSGTTIRDALAAHGIPRRPTGGKRAPSVDAQLADTEWLRSRYAKLGLMGVAAALHTDSRTVGRALDAAGIERLGSNASIAARVEQVVAARDAEWRSVVLVVVTDLGGDPDDYDWPDAET